jgi:hypothetical protein
MPEGTSSGTPDDTPPSTRGDYACIVLASVAVCACALYAALAVAAAVLDVAVMPTHF